MVIIFFGLPGSGKSYLAQRVARTLGADYLSSDVLRKRLITKPTYSYEEKLIVYKKMYDTMYEHKKSSNSLVLDGTFFKRSIRDSFKKLAEDLNMEIKWIEVVSDEEVLKERLSKKRVDSDADYNVHKKIASEFEPLADNHLTVKSTNDNVDNLLYQVRNYLACTTKDSVQY